MRSWSVTLQHDAQGNVIDWIVAFEPTEIGKCVDALRQRNPDNDHFGRRTIHGFRTLAELKDLTTNDAA